MQGLCFLFVLQGWSEQQAVPVQPSRQPGFCRGRAEERPAAPLWGHLAGGRCFTPSNLNLCVGQTLHGNLHLKM